MKKLVFGCGYLGARVADAWLERGEEVLAVTRSASRAEQLKARGMQPVVADITTGTGLAEIDGVGTVLFAVGFDRASGQKIHDVYVNGLRNALEHLPDSIERFIYISSTGVYSQNDGEWIDEASVCRPQREGGQACFAAEQLLGESRFADRVIILRLAGIYGVGRLPKLQDIAAGRAIESAPDGYLNLIHVDDAVRAILAADERGMPPELLLVSDGEPVLRGDFYRELAKLIGSPEPRFAQPSESSNAGQRATTDKRISNRRMQDRLAFELRYPSYREGLAAIVEDA